MIYFPSDWTLDQIRKWVTNHKLWHWSIHMDRGLNYVLFDTRYHSNPFRK